MQTCTIHSRHGIILSCSFSLSPNARVCPGTRTGLDRLSQWLVGKRYAFVDDCEVIEGDDDETERLGEVWSWLKREMCV